MRHKRLTRQLFPLYLSIILLSLAAIGLVATQAVRDFYYHQIREELQAIANLVRQDIVPNYTVFSNVQLDSIAKSLGQISSSRVTLIRHDGVVLGDSEEDPAVMENHADRPEFRDAMLGKTGMSIRYSPTLKNVRMYLALPLEIENTPVCVIRISRSIDTINASLKSVYLWIFGGIAAIAVLAAALSYLVSKRFTRPLLLMESDARKFAEGDLSHRMAVPKSEELARLSGALNLMATQLNDRLKTITEQRNELEAVLKSMSEGVMAIDLDERIISMNRSAGELLNIDSGNCQGISIQEAIMNRDFNEFVSQVIKQGQKLDTEIVISNGRDRFLQANGTVLEDAAGKRIGILVVLNDVTQLRELENHRKDFVANVSHELRTPITSIKGFVETLKDGAIYETEDAERFLEIILRHADRLNAIVDDLLTLSRIEREMESVEIPLEEHDLVKVIGQAFQIVMQKALQKNIKLNLTASEKTSARINPDLLEQALVNLLDNAINYSDEDSKIIVEVTDEENKISISVSDQGCGIPEDAIPRIFERFYRVDKNRSRKVGGTGLGLAIVKHIVLAHNGQIAVESTPEQGSTFIITLPK